ncbi:hypothetical protein [Polaromonas sp.]|uniref:hypothetical protein n=1 Tax=Polaromonas sp. TaxID=1869339 RepID=UPI0027303261|nr:hypothetical protein [Polaromonas sp.]MDP1740083.1 hypothetical protein [Polaromonas sp.]
MKPFNLTLAANETRAVSVAGDYFELRKAPYVLDLVEFLNVDNGVVALIDEAEATDKTRTKEPFANVRITNGATGQTIRFYHGFGDSGSNRFTGVVSGEVSLAAATLAALEHVQVRPEVSTGSFMNQAALVANTAVNVFTAAANVNGAILLSADISEFDATQSQGGFVAKATAPANVADGEPMLMTRMIGAYETTNHYFGNSLSKEQFIAPGLGLYFIRTVALGAANGNFRACRYKLL